MLFIRKAPFVSVSGQFQLKAYTSIQVVLTNLDRVYLIKMFLERKKVIKYHNKTLLKQKPNCLGSLFSLKSLNEMKGEPGEVNVNFYSIKCNILRVHSRNNILRTFLQSI